MHIVLGATGHVGSALVENLLSRGERVTAVVRDASKADALRHRGAVIAVADIRDSERLRAIFRRGARLFLLNPPAPPFTDTDAEEEANAKAILAAVEGSGLEKIVAQSTYGAQPGERLGDLSVLFHVEQLLRQQTIPASIMRAAYLMTNWDSQLNAVRQEGVLRTFFPLHLALPMVAPRDLAEYAAGLMTPPISSYSGETETRHVEGPRRYTPVDVADAFGTVLGKAVKAVSIPRENWIETFKALGFSNSTAECYSAMTARTVDGGFQPLEEVERGQTTLESYISALV